MNWKWKKVEAGHYSSPDGRYNIYQDRFGWFCFDSVTERGVGVNTKTLAGAKSQAEARIVSEQGEQRKALLRVRPELVVLPDDTLDWLLSVMPGDAVA